MSKLSLRGLKIIIIFVMILIAMLGMFTYKLKNLGNSERIFSYLNCFSAGMFMAIGLFHMFPEAVEGFHEYTEAKKQKDPFPLPFCLVFVGYVIVLFIDRVIMHNLLDHGHHHHGTKEQGECKMI